MVDATNLFCFAHDGTRGRQLNTSFSECFHDATHQLEHDGQERPQESIIEKERLILDMTLRCVDEKQAFERPCMLSSGTDSTPPLCVLDIVRKKNQNSILCLNCFSSAEPESFL